MIKVRRADFAKLFYFLSLTISSTLVKSFLVRWASMVLLSASLVLMLMMRVNKEASPLPDPKEFYSFPSEFHEWRLKRTSNLIKRASMGYSFAREMVVDEVLEILAGNLAGATKNEIRRNPEDFLPESPLLSLIEGEELEGEEYLNLLEEALRQIDVMRGD
ncbi:MAG: hypothetical protein DRN35_06460 [Thermoplasmata archaeon]|nr:MAG: hypothetical protein DRN35_06460 [Thermoplasmata archaeon]